MRSLDEATGAGGREEPEEEAMERTAFAWLCERDAGFAPGRAEAFAAWCQEDPRHAEAVARAREVAEFMERELPAVARLLPAPEPEPRHVVRVRPAFPALAWAAALAIAGVLTFWAVRSAAEVTVERVATEAGPPQLVALADGSRVDVNAESRLEVRLTPRERRVELERGEAHFIVAPDADRPFIVTAGGATVRAIGTAFTVAIGPDGTEVVVVEGTVAVGSTAGAPRVTAGERAWLAGDGGARIEPLPADQADRRLAWRRRVESFPDVPLVELVARFNQVNGLRLLIEDTSLASYRIGGTFELDRVDAFVRLLEREGDIVAERRADHTIVLRRAR